MHRSTGVGAAHCFYLRATTALIPVATGASSRGWQLGRVDLPLLQNFGTLGLPVPGDIAWAATRSDGACVRRARAHKNYASETNQSGKNNNRPMCQHWLALLSQPADEIDGVYDSHC